jgi:hypothetical protein
MAPMRDELTDAQAVGTLRAMLRREVDKREVAEAQLAAVTAERDAAVQRAEAAEANLCDADDCLALANVGAQCAAMREALEEAQWGDHQGPVGGMCPKCEGEPGDGFGHFQGCIIGKALSTDAGAALLERLRKAEGDLQWAEAGAAAWHDTADVLATALEAPGSGDPGARDNVENALDCVDTPLSTQDRGDALLAEVRRLRAIEAAARTLNLYEDFAHSEPCETCGPEEPGDWLAARKSLYEALEATK